MSTCFPALPEDAGDKGRSPFQRRKSIDAVVSADIQQNASGIQRIATTAAVPREQPHALSARLLFVPTSVLFLADAAPLIHAQSLSAPAGWTASTTGSIALYKPDNLPHGKTFQLTVQPPQSLAAQPLNAWFTAQVQADQQERGAEAHVGNPQTNPDGTLLLLVPYRDAQVWNPLSGSRR